MVTGRQKEAARPWERQSGERRETADASFRQPHYDRSKPECKAPLGSLPATIKADGLICVAGKHLCSVKGDGALRRTFDPAREMLRGGLAFRLDVLKLAVEAGATRIVATERGKARHWIISMADLRERGWLFEHAKYGAQWCCDLKHWRLIDQSAKTQPETTPEPPQAQQLAMFGVLYE